jgi:hypothetical protein
LLIWTAMIRREPACENDPAFALWIEKALPEIRGSADALASPSAAVTIQETEDDRAQANGTWSQAAGAMLLWRGLADLRIPALARQCAFPRSDALGTCWLFAALAAKCAGVNVLEDMGLRFLAGIQAPDDDLRFLDSWAGCLSVLDEFQAGLFRLAVGHRLVPEDPIRIVMMPEGEKWLLFAGNEAARLWPYSAIVSSWEEAAVRVRKWHSGWSAFLERPPRMCVPPALWERLSDHSPEIADAFPDTLPTDLEPFAGPVLGPPGVDRALSQLAGLVLRAWARWLPGFADASPGYLLRQFIRRPGTVYLDGKTLRVGLESAPLDVVLELAGYLDPIELFAAPGTEAGLPFEKIVFHIRKKER